MPFRKVASKGLGDLLKVLGHPHRLQIVEEIGNAELDVNTLQTILKINHSNVSQHLSILRAHRIVVERREGRSVYYHLKHPEIATWLLGGLKYVAEDTSEAHELRSAIDHALAAWTVAPPAVNGKAKRASKK